MIDLLGKKTIHLGLYPWKRKPETFFFITSNKEVMVSLGFTRVCSLVCVLVCLVIHQRHLSAKCNEMIGNKGREGTLVQFRLNGQIQEFTNLTLQDFFLPWRRHAAY